MTIHDWEMEMLESASANQKCVFESSCCTVH